MAMALEQQQVRERTLFSKVFGWMFLGLLATAVTAFVVQATPACGGWCWATRRSSSS